MGPLHSLHADSAATKSAPMIPLGVVRMVDVGAGVLLPCEEVGGGTGSFGMIVGHGLGSKNPAKKNRRNDDFTPYTMAGGLAAGGRLIWCDARGHGASTGWEESALSGNLTQFSWESLADDMVAVADSYGLDTFVASGSSMGGATSLWAAVKYPDRVQAVVMMRAPTAWESREARRPKLINRAEKMRSDAAAAGLPPPPAAAVLEGAAGGDLPSTVQLAGVRCPVLLLVHGGDDAHPLSTAEALKAQIPDCTLVEVPDKEDVPTAGWPEQVTAFLNARVLNTNGTAPPGGGAL